MNCDYCNQKSKYTFQSGERICSTCLRKYPSDRIELINRIIKLEKEADLIKKTLAACHKIASAHPRDKAILKTIEAAQKVEVTA